MEGTRSSIGVKQSSGPLQMENCLNTKVAFQAEEEAKADARRAARLTVKRSHVDAMESRVFNMMEAEDNKD